jgi:hypothetical protein
MNTVTVMPCRRALAGLQSLAERARLDLQVLGVHRPEVKSEFGDTDRIIRVAIGGLDGPQRRALLAATLILHRTVGGRAEWRIDPATSALTVLSSDPDRQSEGSVASLSEVEESLDLEPRVTPEGVTVMSQRREGALLRDQIVARVLGELAAQYVESWASEEEHEEAPNHGS